MKVSVFKRPIFYASETKEKKNCRNKKRLATMENSFSFFFWGVAPRGLGLNRFTSRITHFAITSIKKACFGKLTIFE